MHAMIIALTTEVSVLTDRADLIERLLAEKGTITLEDIETWSPDDNARTERHDKREGLIRRIFRSVHDVKGSSKHNKKQIEDIDE
jgi:hypothetical protein